jgi:hypothetical protein
MTLCEFQVKAFNARGDDEYLDEVASYLDRLLESGWELIDRERDQCPGWWRVWLYLESEPRATRQHS